MTHASGHLVRNRFRDAVESWLPWYDPAAARRRDAHTEDIRRRSIALRIDVECLRAAYAEYAATLRRRS